MEIIESIKTRTVWFGELNAKVDLSIPQMPHTRIFNIPINGYFLVDSIGYICGGCMG
jgi:hypothetical protein